MVHKIRANVNVEKRDEKKNTYVKAAIITLFIFLSGIMLGIFLDNLRFSDIREQISGTEINYNDAILLSTFIEKFSKEACNTTLDTNLEFNSKIYAEGKSIEDAFNSNRFTPELEQEWRKYILLQTQFWFNSIELKKNCNFNYSNVVHIFNLNIEDPQEKAINKLQSEIMLSLKEKCGNKIMLIPLTADSNLSVVDAVLTQYNITKLPAIIINEKKVFQGLTSLDQLNAFTGC